MKLIDASPIGINIRSTVATYANVHDELRRFTQKRRCKRMKYKAKDFPIIQISDVRHVMEQGESLDVQFLPDVDGVSGM